MKNWTLILISFSTILMTFQLNAQNHRTVEVTVSDTVFRKTNKIIYVLSLDTNMGRWNEYYEGEEDYDYSGEEYMEEYNEYLEIENEHKKSHRKCKKHKDDDDEEVRFVPPVVIEEEIVEDVIEIEEFHYLTKQELMHLLDSAKFNYEVIDHRNYQIGGDPGPILFRLTLNNEEELKRMQTTFAGHGEISGVVKEIGYESIEILMPAAYKDLYTKAQKEALVLAKLSGLTLDKISRIYEHQSEMGDYYESYKEIMKSFPGAVMEPMDFYGKEEIVERTFVFEVK